MEPVNSINDMTQNSYAEDQEQLIELPDGSVIVPDPEASGEERPQSHQDNLAELLPEGKLSSIASELIDLIEKDAKSQEERDELYEEGLKRTGLGKEAPGGANFEGASKAVHPVLAEACVDYASATIREIFPPEGPVKMQVLSSGHSPDLIEKAENKRDYLNWKLTKKIVEYKSELEVLFSQQPLIGSQYIKFWFDESMRRIRCEFVPSDRMILPFAASCLQAAQRYTIKDSITQYELERRVNSGLYRDLRITKIAQYAEETAAERASDKISGKSQDSENVDGLRNIYEVYAYYDVEGQGSLPYIITIDCYEEKILSIYRNWDEMDQFYAMEEWVVEFPFIPWRGAGGIGLTHLIGSLSASATGALRALLDSAHINNFPGAIKLKGAKSSGETLQVGPTEIREMEAPANVDDIRKIIMPLPFNQPSGVLFQLLGFVVDAAKGVVSTAEEKISDATNQMPVGTAMALIEQGSKVFSAIHSRQHAAQERCLAIIQRLCSKYPDDEEQMKVFGKVLVTPEDMAMTGNVVPVSDPNIFSESQRFAQVQGVIQMSQDQAVQWNKHAIYSRLLRLMHVEAPQELLPPLPQPVSADPVTEIVAAMGGQQLKAQQGMNHIQHLTEELGYLLDPVFGAANPSLMNQGFQTIMQDVNEHLILMFQQIKGESTQLATRQVLQMLVGQLVQAGVNPEQMQAIVQQQMASPQAQNMIMQMSNSLFEQRKAGLQQLVAMHQQAAELVKTKVPKPPLDPQAQAALQIATMQEDTKKLIAQLKDTNEKSKMQIDAQFEKQKLDLEKLVEMTIKPQTEAMRQQTEIRKNEIDNSQKRETDLEKNLLDNQVEMDKNREDNRTQVLINQMREEAALERATLLEQMRLQSNENREQIAGINKAIETILSNILQQEQESSKPEGDE